jgi:hypothetical protein
LGFEGAAKLLNAAEQATNLRLAGKIASAVSLFRSEFPDARVDLKPWANDLSTNDLVDPDSIDIAFHFPGWSRRWQSRSILIQIRFYNEENYRRVIGMEAAGFDYRGKQWRLSTIEEWQIEGDVQPIPERSEQLRQYCRQVFELFQGEAPELA